MIGTGSWLDLEVQAGDSRAPEHVCGHRDEVRRPVIAGRRHFGEEREPRRAKLHAAGRSLQRIPTYAMKAIAAEHEIAGDLLAVGQHDHRRLGNTNLGYWALEGDLAAASAQRIDHVCHQKLLRVDVMPEAAQPSVVENIPHSASAELARLAREATRVQPIGESVTIEQRHCAGFDQPGSSPGRRQLPPTTRSNTAHSTPARASALAARRPAAPAPTTPTSTFTA